MDLEKGFDRVSWKVVWWVLRSLGVDIKLDSDESYMKQSKDNGEVNGRENMAFSFRVGVQQGDVLGTLLFVVVFMTLNIGLGNTEKACLWDCFMLMILCWKQTQELLLEDRESIPGCSFPGVK